MRVSFDQMPSMNPQDYTIVQLASERLGITAMGPFTTGLIEINTRLIKEFTIQNLPLILISQLPQPFAWLGVSGLAGYQIFKFIRNEADSTRALKFMVAISSVMGAARQLFASSKLQGIIAAIAIFCQLAKNTCFSVPNLRNIEENADRYPQESSRERYNDGKLTGVVLFHISFMTMFMGAIFASDSELPAHTMSFCKRLINPLLPEQLLNVSFNPGAFQAQSTIHSGQCPQEWTFLNGAPLVFNPERLTITDNLGVHLFSQPFFESTLTNAYTQIPEEELPTERILAWMSSLEGMGRCHNSSFITDIFQASGRNSINRSSPKSLNIPQMMNRTIDTSSCYAESELQIASIHKSLYEVRSRSQRLQSATIIQSEDDHNGAFKVMSPAIKKVFEKYDVLSRKISSPSQVCGVLQETVYRFGRPVSVVIFSGHGEFSGLSVGDEYGKFIEINHKTWFTEACLNLIENNATIVLDSCSTGGKTFWQENLADHLSVAMPGRTVIAPETSTTHPYFQWDNDNFVFLHWRKSTDVTTIYCAGEKINDKSNTFNFFIGAIGSIIYNLDFAEFPILT